MPDNNNGFQFGTVPTAPPAPPAPPVNDNQFHYGTVPAAPATPPQSRAITGNVTLNTPWYDPSGSLSEEAKDYAYNLGKLPVGLVAGTGQALSWITPPLPPGVQKFQNDITKYSTSLPETAMGWVGLLTGGLPLALFDSIPAAMAIGGTEATPSGSPLSHAVGAGAAGLLGGAARLLGLPFKSAAQRTAEDLARSQGSLQAQRRAEQAAQDALRTHLAERARAGQVATEATDKAARVRLAERANAARQAGEHNFNTELDHLVRRAGVHQQRAIQQAIPLNTTRAWYNHIYEGTGVAPPVTEVNPGSSSTIQDDIGARLNEINQRFSLSPASRSSARELGEQVRNGLSEAGRVEWEGIYERWVNTPLHTEGEPFAEIMTKMRQERERLARRAAGQPGDSDAWQLVRGLRSIQDAVENQADGSAADKALRQLWRGAYHKWAILDDATGAAQRGIATPQSLAKSWENHTGNYGGDYDTNAMKQTLNQLIEAHQAPPARFPPRPPMMAPADIPRGRPVKPAKVGKRPPGSADYQVAPFRDVPQPRAAPSGILGHAAHHARSLAEVAPSISAGGAVGGLVHHATGGYVPWYVTQPAVAALLSQTPFDEMAINALQSAGRAARTAGGKVGEAAGPIGTTAGLAANRAQGESPHITVRPLPPEERIPEAQ